MMERSPIKNNLLPKAHHILTLLLALSLGVSSGQAAEHDNRAVAMYNLGLQQYKAGSVETALIFFRRATDLDPDLSDAHYNLGTIYSSQKRYQEAILRFQQVLRISPTDQDALFQLAGCWEATGNKQRAIENYSALTSSYTRYAEAQQHLAKLRSDSLQPIAPQAPSGYIPPCGEVGLAGEIVFTPIAQEHGNRIVKIQNDLNNALLASKDKSPAAVEIAYVNESPVITLGGYQVITVDSSSAKVAGVTPTVLAQRWADTLRTQLQDQTNIRAYLALLAGSQSTRQPTLPPTSSESTIKQAPTVAEATLPQANSPAPIAPPDRPAGTQAPSLDAPIRDKWAVIVGISKFSHPEYNLKFAAKDAQDFRDYLVKDANFRPDHVLTLINEQATRANIMRAFGSKWLPNLVEPGDVVVIYISTHGTPASSDSGKRNYIVAYDTDVNDLYVTAVDMDELARRIKEIKSDRAVIVLDTCYSGAGIPGSRGLQRYDNFNVNNIEVGRGHLVICASSPEERSWESSTAPNGVFTRYFIDSLKTNPKTNVKEAFENCSKKVQWEVKLTRGFTQTPQLGGLWQGRPPVLAAPAREPRPMFLEKFADFGIVPERTETETDSPSRKAKEPDKKQ